MENEIDEIIKNIPDFMEKNPNTIYEINLVNQIYIKKINVFLNIIKSINLRFLDQSVY